MARIFGFDIGTTSIGFAAIGFDPERQAGHILRLGVRVFPEARDPDGTPLNQWRRQKRMARRQQRRRRMRRKLLNQTLSAAGLLPAFESPEWPDVMAADPYDLRERGLKEELSPYEFGRALYHLAQRRHFRGRDLDESADEAKANADEKAAQSDRESTQKALKARDITLGAWLAERGPHDRKRGVHAHRSVVESEFEKLWAAQAKHHAVLRDEAFKVRVKDVIFAQRPVFWRKNTLGECRFMPGEALCPKGAWLSQQRRMLEKLNNLALAGGNLRPLDDAERSAILERLQSQASMTWAGVRAALKPLYKARGEPGAEKSLKFNLEVGGEKKLLGNAIEAKLSAIFGTGWTNHPHKQAIRDAIHQRLWSADYGEIGDQRVVILLEQERKKRRAEVANNLIDDFNIAPEQAKALQELRFPAGWEPYSILALRKFMPHLEAGVRFGALINGPEWEDWRNTTFPALQLPTGEVLDRLPSPVIKEEQERIAKLRNPTVVRTQNELRKVVNNLIDMFGKPDIIRVEVARDVGKSKREREEIKAAIHKQEKRRKDAIKDLKSKGIVEPSRRDVEKWLLWKESQERCPYTGDQIGFDALFREGLYEVEHIWPRSRSFDDSFRNKTLCRKDINLAKSNGTPFECFHKDPDRWAAIQKRLQSMMVSKGGVGMSPGKVKRFLAESIPDDFTARQLNDTGYAARQAVAFLKRLYPDIGPEAPVNVQAVTGRVTAQLRKLWRLNNILADDGEKTRADHRHHAIDALTVACAHPGMTNKLSQYWQARDDLRAERPDLPPPWPTIRADAEKAVAGIVVSHRVRKKVSGPLHDEMPFGDTKENITCNGNTFRIIVKRLPVEKLSLETLSIDSLCKTTRTAKFLVRDARVREVLRQHLINSELPSTKAYPPYPRLDPNGPEIRKVRVLSKQQVVLLAPLRNGYADLGSNHHIAIYRLPNGKTEFEVVSLFEAARRLSRREPVVRRSRDDGAAFVMSLSPGDAIEIPDGGKNETWIVTGAWASGQIVLEKATDANHATTTRPLPGSLLKKGARKVSIDPIGRVRRAND